MPRSEPPHAPIPRLPKSRPPQPSDSPANPSPVSRAPSQSSSTFLFLSSAHREPNIVQESHHDLSNRRKLQCASRIVASTGEHAMPSMSQPQACKLNE